MPKSRVPTLMISFDTEQEMVDFAVASGLKITGHANFNSGRRGRSYWQADTDPEVEIDRNGAYAVVKLPYPSIVTDMIAKRGGLNELGV